jgi:hypothetical protein
MLYGLGVLIILGLFVGAIVELTAHAVAYMFGGRS